MVIKNKVKEIAKQVGEEAVEIGLGALLFGGVRNILRRSVEKVGEHATERARARFEKMDVLRAMFARTLLALAQSPDEEATKNILRRRQEAKKIPGGEDRMTDNICILLNDESMEAGKQSAEAWLTGLKNLGALPDEVCADILCAAENDRAKQKFDQVVGGLKGMSHGGAELVKQITPQLKAFNDWLEKKPPSLRERLGRFNTWVGRKTGKEGK